MHPYEYLTVFISVVVGLAIVHLLSGVSLILDAREDERLDWIHGVWTANVFVTTLVVWWFNFGLTDVRVWTLPFFVNLVAYAVVLYLMAGLLYPVRGADVIDFPAHFERNRPRFFLVCLAFQAVDFFDAMLERNALGRDPSQLHMISLVVFSLGFLIAMRTSSRAYHGALGVAWLVTCLFWAWSGLDQPILVS